MNKQDESIKVCNCNIIHANTVSRVKDLLCDVYFASGKETCSPQRGLLGEHTGVA